MKLAFNSWMYSSFPSWLPAYPIEEVIHRLANIGYDGIEIGAASPVAYPEDLDPKRREEIKKLLISKGIVVSSILPAPGGGPGYNVASPCLKERERSIKYYKDCIDLAHDLNTKVVLYVAGWQIFGVSYKEAWTWSKECLFECAKYALPKGVLIAVEPTPADSNLIETADDALNLMEAANMENVKVMFDTFHVLYRNDIMSDYAKRMGNNLINVHISDLDRLPPGSKSDFRPLIESLKEVGYQGYLTMEIGYGNRNNDPDVFARKSLEYLKSII